MRYFFIPLIFTISLLIASPLEGQVLSDKAEIYLITCDPGPDLYSAFGHTALWVVDRDLKTDYVYNYGVFDFDTPNFYTKFTLGKLQYKVAREPFNHFMRTYLYEGRSVYRQKLMLTEDEKQKLFEILESNYQPENRYYLYDFLYNNCSTKIIEKIEEGIQDPERFSHLDTKTRSSFRQYLHKYLGSSPWIEFGIDLALGLPADKITTVRESMFLPDNLMMNINSKSHQITEKPENVYEGDSFDFPTGWFTPFNAILFISLLLLLLTLLWRNKKMVCFFDGILFGLTGFLGLFLLFLWFGTDHSSMKFNLNILWAMPFNLIYLFRKYFKNKNFLKIYWLAYFVLLAILLISWRFFPQEFNIALFPLVVLLAIRAWMNLKTGLSI